MIGRRWFFRLTLATLLAALLLPGAERSDAQLRPEFVYAYENAFPARIWAFRLDAGCTLTPVPGSPFIGENTPFGASLGDIHTLAYSPAKRMLFNGMNGVTTWLRAANGALTRGPGSPYLLGTALIGLAVVEKPDRTFLYATDVNADRIQGFEVLPNRTLTPLPGFPIPSGASRPLGMNALGDCVFVANTSGLISAFRAQADGSLVAALGSPFALGGNVGIINVYLTPTRRCVYSPSRAPDFGQFTNQIFGFDVSSEDCALTPAAGSPFVSGTANVVHLALDKSWAFGLARLDGSETCTPFPGFGIKDIQAFRVQPDCRLTPVGAPQNSGLPERIDVGTINPRGTCLVLAGIGAGLDRGDGVVKAFSINRRNGHLTAASSRTVGGEDDYNGLLIVP
jgi:hypothetical protein